MGGLSFELITNYMTEDTMIFDRHTNELWVENCNTIEECISLLWSFVEYCGDDYQDYIPFLSIPLWSTNHIPSSFDDVSARIFKGNEPPSVWLYFKWAMIYDFLWWWQSYKQEVYNFSLPKHYHLVHICYRPDYNVTEGIEQYYNGLRLFYI